MSGVCYSYPYPVFQPAMRVIFSITNAFPAVVTTSIPHQYLTGTIIRFNITPYHGMQQANQLFGPITVLSPTTFSIDIDTTTFDPFVIPMRAKYTCSQCIAIGENTNMLTAAEQNVLPYSAT